MLSLRMGRLSAVSTNTLCFQQISSITDSQDTEGYKFNGDVFSIAASLPSQILNSVICGFVYEQSSESYAVWIVHDKKHTISRIDISSEIRNLLEGDNIGWIGVNPHTKQVEYATTDGKFFELETKKEIFEIEKFGIVEVHFAQVPYFPIKMKKPKFRIFT